MLDAHDPEEYAICVTTKGKVLTWPLAVTFNVLVYEPVGIVARMLLDVHDETVTGTDVPLSPTIDTLPVDPRLNP